LSDQGKTEAAKGAIELQRLLTEQNFEESKQVQVKIYCSPLLRAKETADIVVKNLDAHDLKPVVLWDLRERNFGSLNGKSDVHYADVWDEDLKDPDHHQFDVER
jgi:broad specificity phosphatase PhoE